MQVDKNTILDLLRQRGDHQRAAPRQSVARSRLKGPLEARRSAATYALVRPAAAGCNTLVTI